MPRERICHFCGRKFLETHGIMFVKNDGSVIWLCSSKCRKNFLMGRDPTKLKWTTRYRPRRR
ncbi:50S ribosomal protein L24 [archaeon]|nr:50S ribosomal protein L24 [archaeon]